MSLPDPELQPDLEDVLQVEEPEGSETAVKVEQQGPVRAQMLPRRAGGTLTVTVGALQSATPPGPGAKRVLRADPRRAQATLYAADSIMVALSQAGAQEAPTMALCPAGVPIPVTATTDIYVAAVTGEAVVGVIIEDWASGEGSD